MIDEVLDEVAGAEQVSLCDGYFGYYQIGLAEEDRAKTAFTMPWGNFAFKVLSMGLKNGPADFQGTMDEAFGDKKGKSIRVFFDDFCVYIRLVDHLTDLWECFMRMDRAKLSLNALKCVFGVRQGIMLGFLIGRDGIACNPDKVESITQRESPRDLTGVRSFLMAVGYFRCTIDSFMTLAAPLYALLKKGQILHCQKNVRKLLTG